MRSYNKTNSILFTAAGFLLIVPGLAVTAALFKNHAAFGGVMIILQMIGAAACLIYADIIAPSKKKSAARKSQTENTPICKPAYRCVKCDAALNAADSMHYRGKTYCAECYVKEFSNTPADPPERHQAKCSVCGRMYPKSVFHEIDDRRLCEDCFQKQFEVQIL